MIVLRIIRNWLWLLRNRPYNKDIREDLLLAGLRHGRGDTWCMLVEAYDIRKFKKDILLVMYRADHKAHTTSIDDSYLSQNKFDILRQYYGWSHYLSYTHSFDIKIDFMGIYDSGYRPVLTTCTTADVDKDPKCVRHLHRPEDKARFSHLTDANHTGII